MFNSKLIQLNVSLFLWLGIWWHHKIWMSKVLNFDFLENGKRFWSQIKNIFLVLQVLSFRLKKVAKMHRTQNLNNKLIAVTKHFWKSCSQPHAYKHMVLLWATLAGRYTFRTNKKVTKTRYKTCSKITIRTKIERNKYHPDIYLLTMNIFKTIF